MIFEIWFHIIIIIVAVAGIFRGFKKGIVTQLPQLLGMGFGIVCARIFGPEIESLIQEALPFMKANPKAEYVYSIFSTTLIYCVVFLIISFFTSILRFFFRSMETGILSKIFGSVFCLLNYLVFLSLLYNLFLCVTTSPRLLDFVRADDGNMVSEVLLLGPILLGAQTAEDLTHTLQLHDAKKISYNFNDVGNVILINSLLQNSQVVNENA